MAAVRGSINPTKKARFEAPRIAAPLSCTEVLSLLRGHRAQIGNNSANILLSHVRIERIAHRRLELGAVVAGTGGNRGLDLSVSPGADALLLVRGDVARHRYAPTAP